MSRICKDLNSPLENFLIISGVIAAIVFIVLGIKFGAQYFSLIGNSKDDSVASIEVRRNTEDDRKEEESRNISSEKDRSEEDFKNSYKNVQGENDDGYMVADVIDGDTVWVEKNSERIKVRVIGIDTPETVHPNKPVECYGPEASEFAKTILDGKPVDLIYDPTQDRYDEYGRTLAYVIVENTFDFGVTMILNGYAREYTYDENNPYLLSEDYKLAELYSQAAGHGMWGSCDYYNPLQDENNTGDEQQI